MFRVQQAPFDDIHDTAHIYRLLLDTMARPGTVASIRSIAAKIDRDVPAENVALALAYTLLDHEASHFVNPVEQPELADAIARMTFSPRVEAGEADYVFVDAISESSHVLPLMGQVKRGKLPQPEESATLLILVKEAATASAADANLLLSGPGISDQVWCKVVGLPTGWIQERARRIEDYPLGIDLILYTEHGSILALPRTTKVKEVEPSWAM